MLTSAIYISDYIKSGVVQSDFFNKINDILSEFLILLHNDDGRSDTYIVCLQFLYIIYGFVKTSLYLCNGIVYIRCVAIQRESDFYFFLCE